MTITELETLYRRLDETRMSAADRELAKARLAQADALAGFFLALGAGVTRLMRAGSAPAPRSSGLNARVQN
jgi:hypothetical protein